MPGVASTVVDLARLQFATTSIYHFLFVPLTLGLGPLVATMQMIWLRTKDERWLRLTRVFGTLFLINFAIGVATGLVQEFEFGMNWYTLEVLSVVAAIFLPLVLAYQGWTYHVLRGRVTARDSPPPSSQAPSAVLGDSSAA